MGPLPLCAPSVQLPNFTALHKIPNGGAPLPKPREYQLIYTRRDWHIDCKSGLSQ
jgi:hypothetical protein